jgi:calcineurin-like phosphoesterase family protein
MNTFFTADTHFNHSNIIGYCDRPFKNINKMDEEIINKWNRKVSREDIVHHLGDVAYLSYEDIKTLEY